MKTRVCPICCEGTLVPQHFTSVLTHKGVECKLHNFEHSICNLCESEIADAEQTKNNKLLSIEFQRLVDGFMAPSEIKKLRKRLKLTIKDASSLIGGGGVAFSKYENASTRQSTAVDNLLKLLDKHPHLMADLREFQQQRELCTNYQAQLFVEPRVEATPALSDVLLGLFKGPSTSKPPIFRPAESPASSSNNSFFSNWFAPA